MALQSIGYKISLTSSKIHFSWKHVQILIIILGLAAQLTVVQTFEINLNQSNIDSGNNLSAINLPLSTSNGLFVQETIWQLKSVEGSDRSVTDSTNQEVHLKKKRATNVSSENCNEMTPDASKRLDQSLQQIKQSLSEIANSKTVTMKTTSSNCNSITIYTIYRANYIIQQAQLLKHMSGHDVNGFEVLITQYTEEILGFKTFLDNLNVTGNSKLTSGLKEEYNTELTNVLNTINNLGVGRADREVNTCVFYIKSGQIQSALNSFRKINNSTQIMKIVKNAYVKNIDNFDNIVEFVKGLFNLDHRSVFYGFLFEEMKKSNHLTNPKILVLLNEMKHDSSIHKLHQNIYDNANFDKFNDNLKSLENTVTDFMTSWGEKIRDGDYEVVISDLKNTMGVAEIIHLYLPKIVELACADNLDNIEETMKFVRDLPLHSHLYIGFDKLFSILNNTNSEYSHLVAIKMAYNIKEAIRTVHFTSPDVEQKLETIKNKFPDFIKKLIWHGTCTFLNDAWNQYLIFDFENECTCKLVDDCRTAKVFTRNETNDRFWYVEPMNNGEYFTIISKGRYLSAGTNYDSERRNVGSNAHGSKPNIDSYWIIEPVQNKGVMTYAIKNYMNNEYLYVANGYFSCNDGRHRAFSWKSGGRVTQGFWLIDCDDP